MRRSECSTMVSSTLILFIAFSTTTITEAYRIQGSEDENKPFVPYEKGFVGNVQEPTTAKRTRINHGYMSSVRAGDSVGKNRLFSCPSMVGPFEDQKYYCRGKEYGYCDRRSGTCFCNDGYMGSSCEECSPTHFDLGGLCYPKRVCPNDCSAAGECDYSTGTCQCHDHRVGDDCSQSKCSRYHEFCTHCNDNGCVECEQGFSVDTLAPWGSQCEPCYRFDPRCRNCNSTACTACVDLLLLSIHRSGRRPQDPPLPIDEMMRELSIAVPFGSKGEDSFYDAEDYFLVDPALVPLNDSAVECHQGLNSDDSISCEPYNLTSHIMCGNYGTITFESPEYAVREDEKHIRLTVKRSGGGVGEVGVSYSVYPITAEYEDFTSTAHYTTNQTITFQPGQIRASFLIAINDDRVMEQNETFSVHLSKPTGSSRLGTQQRTIVTIIDDDELRTCSSETSLGHDLKDLGRSKAGVPFEFSVFTKTCAKIVQATDGDVIKVIANKLGEGAPDEFDTTAIAGSVEDLGNGTYKCGVNATQIGSYELNVYQLVQGGLKAHYYTDIFLSESRLDLIRIDPVVNFTWATGPVTTFGRDFTSVRWEGFVKPSFSETYTFWIDADDQSRLWIDGVLLIDWWSFSPSLRLLHAQYDLVASETYEIVLEYRDILHNATARLLWSSPSTPITVIPSQALYYKEPIRNSPFHFRITTSNSGPQQSVPFGEGLHKGIAGKEHSFQIQPRDRFSNDRTPSFIALDDEHYRGNFHATSKLLSANDEYQSEAMLPVLISYDEKEKVYTGSMRPQISGIYELSIYEDSQHISGSPFLVSTEPGDTFAASSLAFGGFGNCLPWVETECSGLNHGMAGMESTFTIKSHDAWSNKRDVGGDDWQITVSSDSNDYKFGRIHDDYSNGTYLASIIPTIAGPNYLSILLNGIHIKDSPFLMDVVHSEAVGASSFIIRDYSNANRFDEVFAMVENIFVIQAADEFGNPALYGDEYPYSTNLHVQSDSFENEKTKISFIGGGKYEIRFWPHTSGVTNLNIQINGMPINGSPFLLNVLPGTFSGTKTSAVGPGIEAATAGHETHFFVQSKDEGGNNKNSDEASIFNVRLDLLESPLSPIENIGIDFEERENDSGVSFTQQYVGNGQYKISYTCFKAGIFLLHISSNEGDILEGSPFRVTVTPDVMSAPHSVVLGDGLKAGIAGQLAEVKVYARDQNRNFVSNNAEILEMQLKLKNRHQQRWESDKLGLASGLDDPVENHFIRQLARDNGRGIFVLDYVPSFSGEYDINITTYSKGGLDCAQYSSPDFSADSLIAVLHEDSVDKIFETNHSFGVSWTGKISALHDEVYTISVECSNGGFASLAVDGSYVGWQSCYPVMNSNFAMKADHAVNFSLKFKSEMNFELDSFIVLKWSSPSSPQAKIPSMNLYHKMTVGMEQFHPFIRPSHAFPLTSLAVPNPTTINAVAGSSSWFQVEARDAHGNGVWGNLLLDGNTQLDVHAYNSKHQMQPEVINNENGTHTVIITPLKSGTYILDIIIDGIPVHNDFGRIAVANKLSHIKGSPFLISVQPGGADPSQTELLSKETLLEGSAGIPFETSIQVRDSNRNKLQNGGDTIIALIEPNSLPCSVKYVESGIYSVKCPPLSMAGAYQLDITLADVFGSMNPIHGSPFNVTMYSSIPAPETTTVPGQIHSTTGQFGQFVVEPKDRFGNPVQKKGIHFSAVIFGDSELYPGEKHVRVIDQGDGNYVFAYKVTHPSTYKVHIEMVDSGLLGEYFQNNKHFKEGLPDGDNIDGGIDFRARKWFGNHAFTDFRWRGYISFPHTGEFKFEVAGKGQCLLWIDNEIVISDRKGIFKADEHILYEFKLEYSEKEYFGQLDLRLIWSSRNVAQQVVPGNHFFHSTKPISGSPFNLTVLP